MAFQVTPSGNLQARYAISLTVVEPSHSSFIVSVIPYTLEHTVLDFRKPGDVVNLETDIIARYVERLVGGG